MEQVIEQIAAETGLDELTISRIVKSQFEFLRLEMAQDELNEIRFTYLGRWKVSYKPKPENFKNPAYREAKLLKYGDKKKKLEDGSGT